MLKPSFRLVLLAWATFGLLSPLSATETDSALYKTHASAVVYLQLAVKILPTALPRTEALTKFEEKIGQKVLNEYLPLEEGSGFFVDSLGHLVTNDHVVNTKDLTKRRQDAGNAYANWVQTSLDSSGLSVGELRNLKSSLYTAFTSGPVALRARVKDKDFYEAKVLASEEKLDLALLSVPVSESEPAFLGTDEDLVVGEDVYSLGYPFGSAAARNTAQLTITFTKGAVSALRPDNLKIQHTATINPGSSGGPLLNSQGLVLGINSAQYRNANNTYFAIGAATIREFLARNKVQLPEAPAATGTPAVTWTAGTLRRNVLGEYEVSADLLFNQTPDTQIYLDGKLAGSPPLGLTAPKDTFTIRLDSPAGTAEGKFRLLKSLQGSTEVTLPLLPHRGTLAPAEPLAQGTILVDNTVYPLTAFPLSLEIGPHKVVPKVPGFYFVPQTVLIEKGVTARFTTTHQPAYRVGVEGSGDRPGITATQGAASLSFRPLETVELPEGTWFLSWPDTPSVQSGTQEVVLPGTVAVDFDDFRPKGQLVLKTWSRESKLYVDGALTEYAADGLPLTPGTHRIELTQRGKVRTLKPSFEIRARETATVYAKLEDSPSSWGEPLFWSGLAGSMASLTLTGYGMYQNLDSVALANTKYFDDYVRWKQSAQDNLRWGLIDLGVSVAVTVMGWFLKDQLEREGLPTLDKDLK